MLWLGPWLLSCAQPTALDVASAVRDGDLDRAAELADRFEDWAEPLERWRAVEAARAELARAEPQALATAVEDALTRGDVEAAARALASARELGAAGELEARVVAAVEERAPADRVAAWEILEQGDRAERDAIAARFGADAVEGTAASWVGVDASYAEPLLRWIDGEYVRAPEWPEVWRAGVARLRAVAADSGARAAAPELASPAFSAALATPATDPAGIAAALTGAVRSGVPAGLVLTEWFDAALDALDPWSRVVWPSEVAAWEAHHAGIATDVGLSLTAHEGAVVVTGLVVDGPAFAAGLHIGDALQSVGGPEGPVLLEALPVGDRVAAADALLAGPPNTTAAVSVLRGGAERGFELQRTPYAVDTVSGWTRGPDNAWRHELGGGVVLVRIATFRPHTPDELDARIEALAEPPTGVLLDLRGNPGGDVRAALEVADRFVPGGVLAELQGRVEVPAGPAVGADGEALVPWNAAVPGHALEGTPVAVLVDADSASAAEIVAGVLQERAGAVVLGTGTAGKGASQALRTDATRGLALQLTNLMWTLPSGRSLHHHPDAEAWGIEPSIAVPLSPAERFQVRLQRRQREALRAHADGSEAPWLDTVARGDLPVLGDDPVLLRGLLALQAEVALAP